MKNTLIRAATGLVVVILIVILLSNGPISFAALLLVINFWACMEYGNIKKYNAVFMAVLSCGVFILMFKDFQWAFLYGAAGLVITTLINYYQSSSKDESLNTKMILQKAFPWYYITLILALFMIFAGFGSEGGYNAMRPLAVFVLLWTSDTMQFVSGKLFGKHKLAPKISPKKTIEGFVGGLIFTVGIAAIFTHYDMFEMTDNSLIYWAIIIVVFGSAGDLYESYLKRKAGVKDSGNILPGHGGFLDRFDGLLGAVPFLYLLEILR